MMKCKQCGIKLKESSDENIRAFVKGKMVFCSGKCYKEYFKGTVDFPLIQKKRSKWFDY